jgi:hypothetical protein
MFRWHKNTTRCYAYVSDVSMRGNEGGEPSRALWKALETESMVYSWLGTSGAYRTGARQILHG